MHASFFFGFPFRSSHSSPHSNFSVENTLIPNPPLTFPHVPPDPDGSRAPIIFVTRNGENGNSNPILLLREVGGGRNG